MRRARESVLVLLLYMAVATALAHVDRHIHTDQTLGYTKYAPAVVNGTEAAPARYRVLAPFVYEGIRRLTGLTPRGAWTVFRYLSLFASLLSFHFYCVTWFSRRAAVTGVLLMAALLPLTFTNGGAIPDHFTELCLFTLGCASIARRWSWTFALVLVLNAFNRETSVFLLPLFLLAEPVDRRRLVWTGALGVVWLSVYAGLRWHLGLQLYNPWQLRQNVSFLFSPGFGEVWDWYYRHYAWFGVIMAAPLVWAALSGWSTLPRFVRVSSGLIAPVFFVTAFLFSSILEARMLTPLLPLLLPAVLFLLFGSEGRGSGR